MHCNRVIRLAVRPGAARALGRLVVPSRLLAAALALAGPACMRPPPDFDAAPGDALPLRLSREWADSLECRRNDCSDWFRIDVPTRGQLRIEIDPEASLAQTSPVRASLFEASGATLAQGSPVPAGNRGPAIRLSSEVKPGTYLIALSSGGTRRRIEYRLSTAFEPAPPPPVQVAAPPPLPPPVRPPRFTARRTPVLEIEDARAGAQTILLAAGTAEQMRTGLRGKLLENGKAIGEIVIIDVYPEGSRARIESGLRGAIDASTIAEIQVPVD